MTRVARPKPAGYALSGSRHPDKLPNNLTKEQREEQGIEMEEEDKEVCLGMVMQETFPAITLEQLKDDKDKDPESKGHTRGEKSRGH